MSRPDKASWFDGDPGPKVIELAGGPGAGKTTMVPIVARAVRRAGRKVIEPVATGRLLAARTRPGKLVVRWTDGRIRERALWLIYIVYATALGAGLVARRRGLVLLLAAQLRRPPEAMVGERHVIRWFIRHAGTERMFRRFGLTGEVLIVDEGYVHRVVQLFTSSVEPADAVAIGNYLAQIPEPELLVVVEAPVDVAWSRIKSRGIWTRMSALDESAVATFVRHASKAVGFASDYAREDGWLVKTVDNASNGAELGFELPNAPSSEGGIDE